MPYNHESWNIPELLWNMFALKDCTINCHKKTEILDAFKDFNENIYNKFLDSPAKDSLGPGMFYLEDNYKGIKTEFKTFTVAYCQLILAIEIQMKYDPDALQSLENRMKKSITSAEPFSLGGIHIPRGQTRRRGGGSRNDHE